MPSPRRRPPRAHASLDDLAGRRPSERFLVDEHRLELRPALVLEPVAAADQVDLAIAVDVGLGQPLGRPDPAIGTVGQGVAVLGSRGSFASQRTSDFCTQKAS